SDENYSYYHNRMAWNYRRLAELYCAMNNKNAAIECLRTALKHAKSFDSLPDNAAYTAAFVAGCKLQKTEKTKDWKGTETGMLYYRMLEPVFDSVRHMPEFVALLSRIDNEALPG